MLMSEAVALYYQYNASTDVFSSLPPGENCETLLAPCSPRPCKNGGVCKESEDYQSFSCLCPEGWQGTLSPVHLQTCLCLLNNVINARLFFPNRTNL